MWMHHSYHFFSKQQKMVKLFFLIQILIAVFCLGYFLEIFWRKEPSLELINVYSNAQYEWGNQIIEPLPSPSWTDRLCPTSIR